MNSNKSSSKGQVSATMPACGMRVLFAVMGGLMALAAPSQAGVVTFSSLGRVAALPVLDSVVLVLLAIGLLWLAHRHLSKKAVTTLCLLLSATVGC